MPAPIDYGVKFQDPLQSFMGAYQAGSAIQQADVAQQQQKLIAEGYNKLRQPGATAADYANLAMLLPETQAKSIRESFAMKSEEQKQNALKDAGQIFSAFSSGQPDIAIDMLNTRIEATRNSGDEGRAKFLETWRDVAKVNPRAAQDFFGFNIAMMPGGDKVIEGALKLTAERRAEQEGKKLSPSVQEAIDYGNLTPEQQKTFTSLQALKHPAAITQIGITNVEKAASAELGKLIPDLYDRATSAATQLEQLPRYKDAIDKAITGPFANQRLSAERVANVVGFTGDKKLEATTELIQGLAEMSLQARGMMKGQGQITEFEQKLLIKARSGDITFTGPELKTLFGVAERASKAQYNQSRKLLKAASGKSETAGLFLENVPEISETAPAAPTPSAVLPAGWKVNVR